MTKIEIFIAGQPISQKAIDQWEFKRLNHEYQFLTQHGFVLNDPTEMPNIDAARQVMGRFKAGQSPATFRQLLKNRYTLGNLASKLAAQFSFGRRKYSVTELVVSESSLTPDQVMDKINAIMLENTPEHLYMNLATNPDHFVLLSPSQNVQEVLEITGGAPLPNRFFSHYGDESGLKSRLSEGYHVQAAGTARLADGTIIGGVRHQIKAEGDGFRFKALVEFPAILPNSIIQNHQYHLACEFRQWLSDIVN
ncbi:hypothetical protein [Lacticaseibacillus saniviri]